MQQTKKGSALHSCLASSRVAFMLMEVNIC